MGRDSGLATARLVAILLGVVVIAVAVGLVAFAWVLDYALCKNPDSSCDGGFEWYMLVPAVPIPFSVLAIVLARRSVRAADAWVAGLVLNAFGAGVLFVVLLLSAL